MEGQLILLSKFIKLIKHTVHKSRQFLQVCIALIFTLFDFITHESVLTGEVQDSFQRPRDLILLSLVSIHCHGVDAEHIGNLIDLLVIKLATLLLLVRLLFLNVLRNALLAERFLQEANDWLREVFFTQIPGQLGSLHLLRIYIRLSSL